jgi:hypothetical protein
LDIWVRRDSSNAKRVLAALADFGAPLHDLTVEDLSRPGLIFQMGVEAIRFDVITAIDGVVFEDAWASRVTANFRRPTSGRPVSSTSPREQACRRAEQDLLDMKWLEKHVPKSR